MKFALIDGTRQEAKKGLRGTCVGCGGSVIAKCGEIRAGHWAHERRSDCDPWSEPEGEWHRAWKNHFPDDWQEISHFAESGEKHIADVKTGEGYVIEFQHSPLHPDERRARDAFYRPKLTWVVDGKTRKRDEETFMGAWDEATPIATTSVVRKVPRAAGALLRDWAGSSAHAFLDFGGEQDLFWLVPSEHDFWVNVVRLPRALFVERHRNGEFAQMVDSLVRHIANPVPPKPIRVAYPQPRLILQIPTVEAIRRARARRRRRF